MAVSLRAIVDELDMLPREYVAHLNPETGEIVALGPEDFYLVEEEVDPASLPDWQQEFLPKIREVVEGGSFLALPTSFDIHEYEIMRRFCRIQEPQQREQLLDAIRGEGAFRSFKGIIRRLGLEDDWYQYRMSKLEEIAVAWLERNGIAYER